MHGDLGPGKPFMVLYLDVCVEKPQQDIFFLPILCAKQKASKAATNTVHYQMHSKQGVTRKGVVCSEKFGLAYVVSKMGLLFVYAVDNLAAVYRQRISADPVFLAQVHFLPLCSCLAQQLLVRQCKIFSAVLAVRGGEQHKARQLCTHHTPTNLVCGLAVCF